MSGWFTNNAEADTYFTTRFPSTNWDAISGDDTKKTAVLTTAKNHIIDSQLFSIPSTADDIVKRANAEQAYFLLTAGDALDQRGSIISQGVKSSSVVGESYVQVNGIPLARSVIKIMDKYLDQAKSGFDVVQLCRNDEE